MAIRWTGAGESYPQGGYCAVFSCNEVGYTTAMEMNNQSAVSRTAQCILASSPDCAVREVSD